VYNGLSEQKLIHEVTGLTYISVKEAAAKWGISDRRVRVLCKQGKIPGVVREGRSYLIPTDAAKPADGRLMRGQGLPGAYALLLSGVDLKNRALDQRRPLTQGELERLREEFLIEFTYNSNAIEGNSLTLQETALVLQGITIDQKPLKDHLEAVGHRDAFEYVQQLVSEKVRLTEHIIREIHSLVLIDRPDDKGIYRRIPVTIMGAAHTPPQPYMIPVQMEQMLSNYAKNKRHPIERAAWFHLIFEGIHPFIDGNGRTGRLLINLDLMQQGYPAIDVKYADRKRYYACFDAYYKDSDAAPMVKLIAEYVDAQLDRYLSYLQ
jgi:excisionase family DNA binding protein